MTVWAVIMGHEWPRRVERICSTEDIARRYCDSMNGSVFAGCLWWIEEWTVSP